jgi:hypothetical protein
VGFPGYFIRLPQHPAERRGGVLGRRGLRQERSADRFTPWSSRNRDYATSWAGQDPSGQRRADDAGLRQETSPALDSQLLHLTRIRLVRFVTRPSQFRYHRSFNHPTPAEHHHRPASAAPVASRHSPHAPALFTLMWNEDYSQATLSPLFPVSAKQHTPFLNHHCDRFPVSHLLQTSSTTNTASIPR